jgi:hypothetical protein
MDQASRIIGRLAGVEGVISQERIACGAWKRAVGKRIAARTRAAKLVRTTLIVEVEDEIWRKNLWSLRFQILRNLEKAIGPEIVSELSLRVMPLRIEPQRASQVDNGERLVLQPLDGDDSNAIEDPGLRRIYRASRRRETA